MDLKHAIPPDDAVRIAQLLWGLVCLPGSALTVALEGSAERGARARSRARRPSVALDTVRQRGA